MNRSFYLKFNCPSCGGKLAGIEPVQFYTQVVKRTCRGCGDRWQLVVKVVKVTVDENQNTFRIDRADITFLDSAFTRGKK